MVNFQFQQLKDIVNLKVVTLSLTSRIEEKNLVFTRSVALLTTTSIRVQIGIKSVKETDHWRTGTLSWAIVKK